MSGQGGHFAIVVGGFYEQLAQRLIAGATAAYEQEDATFEIFEVPGAFELPLAASYAAASGRFDGVACLGAVIRGETSHYDYVCAEAARGVQDVPLQTHVPCAFGVLTVREHGPGAGAYRRWQAGPGRPRRADDAADGGAAASSSPRRRPPYG